MIDPKPLIIGVKFEAAAKKPQKSTPKRPPPFSIRFTDEERAQLDRAAGALSLAAFIRLKLFVGEELPPSRPRNTKKPQQPSAELAVLGNMLGALGQSRLASNLNQIAKAANIGTLPMTPELEDELWKTCAEVQRMRAALISALGVKAQ